MATEYPNNCGSGDNMKVDGDAGFGVSSPGASVDISGRGRVRGAGGGGGGFWLSDDEAPTTFESFMGRGDNSEEHVGFYSNGAWRLVVKDTGRVGIGTTSPLSGLEVDGADIEVDDYNRGVILRSADGSRWRVRVDNNGQLGTSKQ